MEEAIPHLENANIVIMQYQNIVIGVVELI